MTIILAAVLVLAIVLVGYLRERSLIKEHRLFVDALCKAAHEERSELLNRIQAPDRIPVTPMPDFAVPEREPDEWHQVGQITISDKYGLDD